MVYILLHSDKKTMNINVHAIKRTRFSLIVFIIRLYYLQNKPAPNIFVFLLLVKYKLISIKHIVEFSSWTVINQPSFGWLKTYSFLLIEFKAYLRYCINIFVCFKIWLSKLFEVVGKKLLVTSDLLVKKLFLSIINFK